MMLQNHPLSTLATMAAMIGGAFSTGVLSQATASGSIAVDYTAVILAGFAFLTLLVNTFVSYQAKQSADKVMKEQEKTHAEITATQDGIVETKEKVQEVHLIINSRFSAFEKIIAEKELARGNLQGRDELMAEQAAQAGEDALKREVAGSVVSVTAQTVSSNAKDETLQSDVIADTHKEAFKATDTTAMDAKKNE